MKKFLNHLPYIFLIIWTTLSSCDKTGKVKVYEKNQIVTLENQITGLSFDLAKGTYCVTDNSSGKKVLTDAKLKINEWSSDDEGFNRTWGKRNISDTLGTGIALDLSLGKENSTNNEIYFQDL